MIAEPALDRIAQSLIVESGVAPGASLGLAQRVAGTWRLRLGAAGFLDWTRRQQVSLETPFDLASVTKPFLALTLARLDARGALVLSDPLESCLPESAGSESARVPLELLLAHRAGLEAHRTLYSALLAAAPLSRADCLRQAARARRADAHGPLPAEGYAPLYSDLGYLLLGAAVERTLGLALDEVIRAEVAAPLGTRVGSARQALVLWPEFAASVAPTEVVPWRGGVVRGVVHDENAWAMSGHGVAGHAGLFGTAEAVLGFGCAMLDILAGRSASYLSAAAGQSLVRPRAGSTLRAGFDGISGTDSSAGSRMGASTFGHLGFTGTSLWCDPDSEAVTVLLTNRVHPTRDHIGIRKARPRVQDALLGLLFRDE